MGQGSLLTLSAFEGMRKLADGSTIQDQIAASNLSEDHIMDILRSAWWTRLWVYQEAMLAKIPIVHSGSAQIPFWTLIRGLRAVRHAALNGWFPLAQRDQWVMQLDAVIHSYNVQLRCFR
ncbi:hypothetical protein CLAFUW4_03940 [Fulvia fulva]|uniref:Heterokaryon incompatibility domain-containing protein n=1 Tax=Passalora fulva TaxID=5499 RepID=A0A9Q8LG91_PASFU|nr:uncharacterized protein CLAFUR5_03908 [Fulvia fulva]KAK4626761.1 hypothetical protein CLAFUR4_03926 [Fulvia fulva]KAK4628480.1 hypothetical protein CLAFUR0_03927 [Fulvia fulva]UJO16940.1 hypothetical protein CLAFUR5_03908 [Fulvia fulva]WPV13501.1 hypothetical protein CLAFUW4_03940 [Fulvia fulva]WPV28229.1 hypothetical protein CLAFUW7_03929 [Fulvia fulva]